MARRAELAGVYLVLAGKSRDHLPRNEVANLPENSMVRSRWPGCLAHMGTRRFRAEGVVVVFHSCIIQDN